MYSATLVLLIGALSWCRVEAGQDGGSCAKARLCCDGKDTSCVVQPATSIDILTNDPRARQAPCYCDHGCLNVGDCCSDFKDYCGVMDCKVGEWSDWSSCDVTCGTGTSTRHRQVVHPESNGGAQCPTLEERKPCSATQCSKRYRDKVSALKESAMLLPGKYAKKSVRNRYDVRSNLRSYQKPKSSEGYCVVFQVDKATRSCLKNKDTRDMTLGNTVCVQCNSKAIKSELGGRCIGHGAEGKRTRFKNILSPRCHGKWTRLELVEGEDCPCKGGPDFVFV